VPRRRLGRGWLGAILVMQKRTNGCVQITSGKQSTQGSLESLQTVFHIREMPGMEY
jgi:hypothetical protein